jgi:hypothetical protein
MFPVGGSRKTRQPIAPESFLVVKARKESKPRIHSTLGKDMNVHIDSATGRTISRIRRRENDFIVSKRCLEAVVRARV